MLINGEKYACEACVRGHRVSNCQHSDRPLTHINKKGRPVSQCQHCRSMRKSRSAHVKCECGEKTHGKGPCHHLKDGHKEGDAKADHCCCGHGGRCSCSHKKEHLDPVPEAETDENATAATSNNRRPRAFTVQSDGGLTVFTNGHHKPAVKHNKMAHQCGLPYVVPRGHTIHGSMPNRSVDNLPHTNTIDALHRDSHIKDSMVSAQQEQRMVKSEHNSPVLAPSNLTTLNGQLPPLDLSALDGLSDSNFGFPMFDNFGAMPETEQPMFSAGLSSSASIDWSHYPGLDFNNESFVASPYSQAPSYSNFDFASVDQPTLTTTSTSGEISEAEDFVLGEAHSQLEMMCPMNDVNSEFSDPDTYQISKQSSFIGIPQGQMMANNEFDDREFADFFTGSAAYTPPNTAISGLSMSTFPDEKALQAVDESIQLSMADKDDVLWMNDFTTGQLTMDGREESQDPHLWAQ